VLGLRRFAPVVPASLVAVALGIALVELFSLDDHGVAIVGQIDSGLPSFGPPDVSASDYGSLGGANLATGLSSGMVLNGSLSKTAVNAAAGARTQLSGLVVAVMTIVTLLVLTGLFESLPDATLAAVVIAALIDLVDLPALAELCRVYTPRLGRAYRVAARPDFIAALAALLGVLVFDTLPGLFIGIGVSLLLLLYRTSRRRVAVLGRVPGSNGQYADVEGHPATRWTTA
jgi:MFS superfamily sulfate permease-like transporter